MRAVYFENNPILQPNKCKYEININWAVKELKIKFSKIKFSGKELKARVILRRFWFKNVNLRCYYT